MTVAAAATQHEHCRTGRSGCGVLERVKAAAKALELSSRPPFDCAYNDVLEYLLINQGAVNAILTNVLLWDAKLLVIH